jgi:hypothetical protein
MPNYQYVCQKCGHEDTEIRKVEDRNEPKECTKLLTGETILTNSTVYSSTICNGQMKLKIGNPPFKMKD